MPGTAILRSLAALLSLAALSSAALSGAAANRDRIRPCEANPWYWQYKGKPVLLLGGSKDDNLFQIPDLRAHLDEMKRVGANYIRNTMSDRPDGGFEVYPYLRLENGKYDLDRWNPEYWRRFSEMLALTRERGIIVQIELWDRFDFFGDNWRKHPCNPANNVNYTHEQSGLAAEYPDHPGLNRQPFFFTTPAQRNNALLLRYQTRFIDEVLRLSLPFPNVLYCVDNETSGEEAWGAWWADHIRRRATESGVEVFVTEMWDDWDLGSGMHRRTFDHPERYGFVDVSQNNHQSGQTHWDRFQQARSLLASRPRPMNTVKTYGADTGRFGSTREGIERWWRHLMGGAAAVRFHRPDSGLGLSDAAKASIRAARKLESVLRLWDAVPANDLLAERAPNEAYAAVAPGKAIAVFFPSGGSVRLKTGALPRTCTLRWISVQTGEWGPRGRVTAAGALELKAPDTGAWVGVLTGAGR